jgi:hypothetical protein
MKFLDYCSKHGIKVLAPVSNYFLLSEGLPKRNTLIPALIDSFSNKEKTDYHPAIAAIIIGNEPEISRFTVQNCIDFTTAWATIEASRFSGYREVPIGHPVDFGTYGAKYPCFGFWDPLLAALNAVTAKNLNMRLFLAPQTYSDAEYLFENAASSGKSYIDLAYEKYQKPLLFTEIGYGRNNPGYEDFVQKQLAGAKAYHAQYPDRLTGICFFQFADKVWKQGESEGMFGAFSHSDEKMCMITYGPDDFTHWENNCANSVMSVNTLVPTPLQEILIKNYIGETVDSTY